jgi:hypothetical protein
MKIYEQKKFEAMKRAEEIARKGNKIGVLRSGNVQTSFARNNKEYLANHGFYFKDSDRKPTKDSLCEKRLNKMLIEIDVRKAK